MKQYGVEEAARQMDQLVINSRVGDVIFDLYLEVSLFHANPSALVLIEDYEGITYVDEWIYQSKLTTQDLIDEMMILGVSRSKEIFADCASPGAIEELKRAGYNLYESDKNVIEGIRKVKSKPLRITSRSTNLMKEIKSYKWKQTKDGQIAIPEQPVKFNDHGMDAMRYAIYTKLTRPEMDWVAF
jgi:phage terminase large subunit